MQNESPPARKPAQFELAQAKKRAALLELRTKFLQLEIDRCKQQTTQTSKTQTTR